MSDEGLYQLYKLHKIDAALLDIKSKAENLDTGKREAALAKQVEAESESVRQAFATAAAKFTELKTKEELALAKLDKFQKQLYSGSLTNPREVENVQKEIDMLENLVVGLDDELKATQAERDHHSAGAKAAEEKIAAAHTAQAAKRKSAEETHHQLQASFREIGAKRADAEKKVAPNLLQLYAAARKKTGSTGMALITADQRCSACGIDIPERTQEMVRDGKPTQCESCRRLLFILHPGDE